MKDKKNPQHKKPVHLWNKNFLMQNTNIFLKENWIKIICKKKKISIFIIYISKAFDQKWPNFCLSQRNIYIHDKSNLYFLTTSSSLTTTPKVPNSNPSCPIIVWARNEQCNRLSVEFRFSQKGNTNPSSPIIVWARNEWYNRLSVDFRFSQKGTSQKNSLEMVDC